MSAMILVGIALHWLLHFLGGTLVFGATLLYDVWLPPSSGTTTWSISSASSSSRSSPTICSVPTSG